MTMPSNSLLNIRLPCGRGVDDELAMRACSEAAAEVGLTLGARTPTSLVFLPGAKVTRSLLRCMAPGLAQALEPATRAGAGVAAELLSRGGDGLAISIMSPKEASGEAFVSALRARLQRAKFEVATPTGAEAASQDQ
eukprot:CAMPEP_0206547654 /NCGR_PEP_ID=MMETSP0325_2-20121206/13422_1 /ASSEMBLY_ACC=CAM_ASM_000347 /TAXON_ID=2866 /ORGANISM="Crypthecodinium cohnii, Strain Seligo" /LENGTH=136 /DNA_ID=CAMNT_0054046995 /DNA_START=81 /DNA_END=488 /DNA_ORIENTATION=-